MLYDLTVRLDFRYVKSKYSEFVETAEWWLPGTGGKGEGKLEEIILVHKLLTSS